MNLKDLIVPSDLWNQTYDCSKNKCCQSPVFHGNVMAMTTC